MLGQGDLYETAGCKLNLSVKYIKIMDKDIETYTLKLNSIDRNTIIKLIFKNVNEDHHEMKL